MDQLNSEKDAEAQKRELEKLADSRLVSIKAHMKDLEDCDDLNMR